MKKRNNNVRLKKLAKKMKRHRLGKLGVLLTLFLSVTVLIINIVSASYSWFSPTSKEGVGVKFQQNDYMRSEQCSYALYEGDKDEHGVITYPNEVIHDGSGDNVVTNTTVTATSSTDLSEDLYYYRIVVENTDTQNASNVSLYFTNVPAGTTIGVVKPSNSCHEYSTATNDVTIVRNAYVKKYTATEVDPGLLRVEFYVRCTGNSFTFDERNIYLLYN